MVKEPDNNKNLESSKHLNLSEFESLLGEVNSRYAYGERTLSENYISTQSLSEQLIIAVAWGSPLERIESLIALGANPDFCNQKGVSAKKMITGQLNSNRSNTDIEYFKEIKKLFDKVSYYKNHNEHLLIAVSNHFSIEDIEKIIKFGANPDFKNSSGISARTIIKEQLDSNISENIRAYYKNILKMFSKYEKENPQKVNKSKPKYK